MTSDPARSDELAALLFDGAYDEVHRDIAQALHDPVFDAHEGLSMPERGRLAHRRARVLHGRLESPQRVVADPRRLFALAEWPPLLDASLFSLLMVHYNLCLGTVVAHGGGRDGNGTFRPEVQACVEELDGLRSFGLYMATELGYGNNVAALRTEARHDPESATFTLHTPDPLAQKFMSCAAFPDIPKVAVVLARLVAGGRNHGVFPFLVRVGDGAGLCAGIHAAPCPEQPVQGVDQAVIRFDHVRVPQGNLLLGDMGEFTAEGTFRAAAGNPRRQFQRAMARILPGRLCVTGSAVAAGRAATYIALRYAARRLTNAPGRPQMPVLGYRSHQLALFTSLSKVYAATFLLNHAKRSYVEAALEPGGTVPAGLATLISVTKALCTGDMERVVAECRERCGAQGLFSVNRLADYGSLLQGLVTAEGDNQVLLLTAAGRLLAPRPDGPAPAPPVPAGRDLSDPELHAALLRHREESLRASIRAAMSDASATGTYFDSWNGSMNSAVAMTRAHGARLALERCREAAAAARDDAVREALGLLTSLYGLCEIQRDAGWYLAHDLLTARRAESVPAAMDALCARLLPHAELLTDAFRLSPRLLRAPITADDYVGAFQRATGAAAHFHDTRPERATPTTAGS
jgi:acyl-CoA oxidase